MLPRNYHIFDNFWLKKGIFTKNIKEIAENQENRIDHLVGRIHTHYGDLLDSSSLESVVRDVQPDEIYNLGAQSHVRVSFDQPAYTFQSTGGGALNVLEAARQLNKRKTTNKRKKMGKRKRNLLMILPIVLKVILRKAMKRKNLWQPVPILMILMLTTML